MEHRYAAFRADLQKLINQHGLENGSDTPDWLLAEYLTGCLKVWNETCAVREGWHGRPHPQLATLGGPGDP